jgi:hypothetical protein
MDRIQQYLGHRRIESTEIYTERVRENAPFATRWLSATKRCSRSLPNLALGAALYSELRPNWMKHHYQFMPGKAWAHRDFAGDCYCPIHLHVDGEDNPRPFRR